MKTIRVTVDGLHKSSTTYAQIMTALEAGETVTLEPKLPDIELSTGNHIFDINGTVIDVPPGRKSGNCLLGMCRKAAEQAKLAADGMLRRKRLSALTEEVGNGEAEYVEDSENWFVYLDENVYVPHSVSTVYSPTEIYMDRDTAIAVCKALNERRFEL